MKTRMIALTAPILAMLIAPPVAMAIEVNEDFKPQNEFYLDPWVTIELGPLDMSINKFVLYLFLAAVLTIFVMVFIANRMQARPNRIQTVVELTYRFVRDTLVRPNIDNEKYAKRWFAFIGTLFIFIWCSNIIGFIPLPVNSGETVSIFGIDVPTFQIYAATANFSMPIILTLVVWIGYHIEGIREKGPINYVKSFIPAGIEGPILLLVAPIEVLSQFVRIISLSARLFANMLAGHLLIIIMGGGLAVLLGLVAVGVFTLPIAVAFYIFELGLVASLQAFIFAILASIYIGGATTREAH
jgi:F-type H+-transporting ATPase subunit a